MNVEKEILSLEEQIKVLVKRMAWLRKHRGKLEALPATAYIYTTGSLDMDGLLHKQVIQVIRAIGGKWKKTPSGSGEVGRIDYETELDGVPVRLYSGHAPPSCRIVEVEELVPEKLIPAHTVKVRKMVCNPELAAQIAVARKEPMP